MVQSILDFLRAVTGRHMVRRVGVRLGATSLLLVILTVGSTDAAAKVITRQSTAEVDEDVEWRTAGFRLAVGGGYESFVSLSGGAPALDAVSFAVRPGWQLDEQLLIGAFLRYSVSVGDWSGVRWLVGPSVEIYPWRQWFILGAVGYAGFQVSRQGRTTWELQPGPPGVPAYWNTVYEENQLCDAHGVGVVLGSGYRFALGETFATGPYLEANGQWSRCTGPDPNANPDPFTGARADRSLWWAHLAWSASWVLNWR